MIYTDFKSIPVPEDNGKQNLDESYRNEMKITLVVVMVKN